MSGKTMKIFVYIMIATMLISTLLMGLGSMSFF
ncbi:stressosome-associated protein Prli42 [Lottiidibacillus patelloidae]|nr:stressosome-associated protein Prli42 [Lottiidibacillus patelloidae]